MENQLLVMLVIPLVMYLSVEKSFIKNIIYSVSFIIALYYYLFVIDKLETEMYIINFLFLFIASIGMYISVSVNDSPKYLLVLALFIHIFNMFLLFISSVSVVGLLMYMIVGIFLTLFWINIKKSSEVNASKFILYIIFLAIIYYANIYQLLNVAIILLTTVLIYKRFNIKNMILLGALLLMFNIANIVSVKVEFYSVIIAMFIFPIVSMEEEIRKHNKNVLLNIYMLCLIVTIILGVIYLYLNNTQIIYVAYYTILFSYMLQAVIKFSNSKKIECF